MKAQYADNTVIVTQTRCGESEVERVRARLAINMIEKASDLGYRVVVMDGGSVEEVKKSFVREGVELIEGKQEGEKFGSRRRVGFQIAQNSGREAIVWTEPEKEGLVSKLDVLVRPVIEREADLVVAERESLDSYPEYQREFEIKGNSFFENLTGRKLDVWFAPRVFTRDVAKYFIDYDGRYGDLWEGIFVPILNVIRDGKIVLGVKVDYEYPSEQARIEENSPALYEKRRRQYEVITQALRAHAEKLGMV